MIKYDSKTLKIKHLKKLSLFWSLLLVNQCSIFLTISWIYYLIQIIIIIHYNKKCGNYSKTSFWNILLGRHVVGARYIVLILLSDPLDSNFITGSNYVVHIKIIWYLYYVFAVNCVCNVLSSEKIPK